MDIVLLKTFLEVARYRHFGKASERLFITQSAVSARIKLLEERIGEPLFVRKRNAIALTDTGELLLPHADKIVRSWEHVWRDVRIGREYATSLRIGTTADLWRCWASDWIDSLLKEDQQLALRVEIGDPQSLLEQLIQGDIDLAFLIEAPRHSELLYRDVGAIELRLVSTRQCLSLEEVGTSTFWSIDWGLGGEDADGDETLGTVMPRLSINSGLAALHHLKSHDGTAWLPIEWVEGELESGSLHTVENCEPVMRSVYLIWRADNHDNWWLENMNGERQS